MLLMSCPGCYIFNGVLRPESNYLLQSRRRAELCTVGWVNWRKQWRLAVCSFLTLLLILVQTADSSWRRKYKNSLRDFLVFPPLLQARIHPTPPFAEWYAPCCLGELTLLPAIGRISRAHCFQKLSVLSGCSCLLFILSLDVIGF